MPAAAHLRTPRPRAAAVLCLCALLAVLGGSAGAGWVAGGGHAPQPNVRTAAYVLEPSGTGTATQTVSAEHAGLTATISARTPGRSGVPLTLRVTFADEAALGAVGPSSISFGDGSRVTFAQPQFCRVEPAPDQGAERLVHRYRRPGEYTVRLSVVANCTPGTRVTLRLPVRIEQ